jgi:hypothetical protein
MRGARVSRTEVALMVAVPVGWAVLLLFHPTGDGDEFYPIVRDQLTAWMVVHVGTLPFVPLLAGVVYLLLRGVEGVAALLSRIALAVFAVFYTAFEVLIGLGTGILVDQVNGLPAAERATGARLVEDFTDSGLIRAFELIGSFAWLTRWSRPGSPSSGGPTSRARWSSSSCSWSRRRPSSGTYRHSGQSVSPSSSPPCSWSCAAGRALRRPPRPDSRVTRSALRARRHTQIGVVVRRAVVPLERSSIASAVQGATGAGAAATVWLVGIGRRSAPESRVVA